MNRSLSLFFKSDMEHVTWPNLFSPGASSLLATQYVFDQTQWLSPQQVKAKQLVQLNEISHYARRHVPFYRKRLKHLLKAHTRLDWDLWRSIPLLSRNDVQKNAETLLSTHIPAQHGKISKVSTSGSTGKPVTVYQTELSYFFWRAFTLREHLWHGRDFSGKLAIIRFVENEKAQPPNGLHLPGWGPATNNIFFTGPSCVLDIQSTIKQQAAWLLNEQPHYILTHPTNIAALAQFFQESGKKLHNLKEIRTLSESLTENIRKICVDVWGVPVTDMYTTREVGYIALQCPGHEHYHVQAENVLVEILDDDGKPCAPGEIGRVVVTNLNNFAFPLLRYDIGDYAEFGVCCPCGRGLPVINRVMGRVRNMLTFPSGEQNWPVFDYRKYREAAPVKQAQFIQKDIHSIDAYFVAERPLDGNEEKQLEKAIQETLGYPFTVTIILVDEIPRSPGGKFEEFLSLVN